jgi:uncharacterized protein (DUF362 family)
MRHDAPSGIPRGCASAAGRGRKAVLRRFAGVPVPGRGGEKDGAAEAAQDLGIALADFRSGREVHFAQGQHNKKFTIANAVLDSDAVVSLPKMKTHGFQRVTGAVKNQFGCVTGALKGEFHVKMPDAFEFAKMLIDLNACVHPSCDVMDGVMAMEGNGPRRNPEKMNVLLFSDDPIALDATMCRLMNLDPSLVLTNKAGLEMVLAPILRKTFESSGNRSNR